jgi:hypothetical protein
MPRQRQQAQDVLASSVLQKTQAFARTIFRPADPRIIETAQSQPVQRESPAANFARNLVECVVICFSRAGDGHQSRFARPWRSQQADRTLRDGRFPRLGFHADHPIDPSHSMISRGLLAALGGQAGSEQSRRLIHYTPAQSEAKSRQPTGKHGWLKTGFC